MISYRIIVQSVPHSSDDHDDESEIFTSCSNIFIPPGVCASSNDRVLRSLGYDTPSRAYFMLSVRTLTLHHSQRSEEGNLTVTQAGAGEIKGTAEYSLM
jgi:hypothetical protein